MKYFLLGAFSSAFFLYGIALLYGFAGSFTLADIDKAVSYRSGNNSLLLVGMGLVAVGLLFKVECGAVPRLDARRLPGRAHRSDGVHGGLHEARGLRCAACGLLRVARWRPLGLAADDVDHRRAHDGDRIDHRDHPDRREADAGLLVDRARGIPDHRVRRRAPGHLRSPATEITSLQAVLFYLVAYGFTTIGAFAVVTVVRDAGWRGDPSVALGRARQGGTGRRRRVRVLPAGVRRHPAHQRVHRQVGGVHVGLVGWRLAAGRGRRADERGRCVLLRPRHRGDVLLRPDR